MLRIPRYESREDKGRIFYPNTYANHKEEVDQLFEMFENKDMDGQFLFRGAKSASHKLYTSLQRFWIGHELYRRGGSHVGFVGDLLNETRQSHFKTITRYFPQIGLDPNNGFALLSYMQHHGAPTPFLDFTEDPFVAMWFAFQEHTSTNLDNELDQYASVYSIPRSLSKTLNKPLKATFDNWKAERGEEYAQKAVAHYVDGFSQGSVLIIADNELNTIFGNGPKRVWNNLKIVNQRGLFVFNGSVDIPLMEEIVRLEADLPTNPFQAKVSEAIKAVNIHRNLTEYVRTRLASRTPSITKEFILPSAERIMEKATREALSKQ